jgi:UDP-N-acetylglucosamine--N-acetylmuramyl-(pentapeptide) pyrophosphoryl-undecaprenol N-acetylglucosamine transferase
MTIILTGGGSGGHITPVLAVAKALKQIDSDIRTVYIGQRGDGLGDIAAKNESLDTAVAISAGKFRRYHGEGLKQLLDFRTMGLNLRDVYRVIAGFFQAFRILRRERPAVVFVKGGFVGVPVGLAAALLRIPYVTHDSDAIPGLANRIIAPWAKYHAVGLPKELYSYQAHQTVEVGVPVADTFRPVSEADQQAAKQQLGYKPADHLLLITGGGLGAERINQAILLVAGELLTNHPKLRIVHLAGRANQEEVQSAYEKKLAPAEQGRVAVLGYSEDLQVFSAAADLIITRAGATSIAEFAVQGKACILVPSPFLAGGHQLKNAAALQEAKAVAVLEEKNLGDAPLVLSTIAAFLEDDNARATLASNIQTMAHPQAAAELAGLLIKVAERTKKKSEA